MKKLLLCTVLVLALLLCACSNSSSSFSSSYSSSSGGKSDSANSGGQSDSANAGGQSDSANSGGQNDSANAGSSALSDKDLLGKASHTATNSSSVTRDNKRECKYTKLNGVVEFVELSSGDTLTVTSDLTKGSARLAVCTGDSVLYEFSVNGSNQSYTVPEIRGKATLRLLGEDCNISVKIVMDD